MDTLPFYLSYGALWILVILHSLVLLGMLHIIHQVKQNGAVGRGTGMAPGQEAPSFSGADLSGVPISSASFAGETMAILFISPTCQACTAVLKDDMKYLDHKSSGNLLVVCQADHDACVQLAEAYNITAPVIADQDNYLTSLYQVSSVPTAVLINADGYIHSYGQPGHKEEDAKAATAEPLTVAVQREGA
jgi:peroxiredoxin